MIVGTLKFLKLKQTVILILQDFTSLFKNIQEFSPFRDFSNSKNFEIFEDFLSGFRNVNIGKAFVRPDASKIRPVTCSFELVRVR